MNKTHALIGALAVMMATAGVGFAKEPATKTAVCGGGGGVQCPNGSHCVGRPLDDPEGMGTCEPIDMPRLTECLKAHKVTVICSNKYKCKKQQEMLGSLFNVATVTYDDDYTDCARYGKMCETIYHDREIVGWMSPEEGPFPGETLAGPRTIEQVMWLAGCETYGVEPPEETAEESADEPHQTISPRTSAQ